MRPGAPRDPGEGAFLALRPCGDILGTFWGHRPRAAAPAFLTEVQGATGGAAQRPAPLTTVSRAPFWKQGWKAMSWGRASCSPRRNPLPGEEKPRSASPRGRRHRPRAAGWLQVTPATRSPGLRGVSGCAAGKGNPKERVFEGNVAKTGAILGENGALEEERRTAASSPSSPPRPTGGQQPGSPRRRRRPPPPHRALRTRAGARRRGCCGYETRRRPSGCRGSRDSLREGRRSGREDSPGPRGAPVPGWGQQNWAGRGGRPEAAGRCGARGRGKAGCGAHLLRAEASRSPGRRFQSPFSDRKGQPRGPQAGKFGGAGFGRQLRRLLSKRPSLPGAMWGPRPSNAAVIFHPTGSCTRSLAGPTPAGTEDGGGSQLRESWDPPRFSPLVSSPPSLKQD